MVIIRVRWISNRQANLHPISLSQLTRNRLIRMEIHFINNDAMSPLVSQYFIPSLPSDFRPVRHRSDVATSERYADDGYFDLIVDKIETILSIIESSLDGQLMFWSDVDVVFNQEYAGGNIISKEIEALAEGKDLLLQMEFPDGIHCNTGIQIIRRNTRTLIFYAQVRLMLHCFGRSDQVCVNHLLGMIDGVEWAPLPISYSNTTNRGLSASSRLYHANSTPAAPQGSKCRPLLKALQLWSGETWVDTFGVIPDIAARS
jgi:hypothetical protein